MVYKVYGARLEGWFRAFLGQLNRLCCNDWKQWDQEVMFWWSSNWIFVLRLLLPSFVPKLFLIFFQAGFISLKDMFWSVIRNSSLLYLRVLEIDVWAKSIFWSCDLGKVKFLTFFFIDVETLAKIKHWTFFT